MFDDRSLVIRRVIQPALSRQKNISCSSLCLATMLCDPLFFVILHLIVSITKMCLPPCMSSPGSSTMLPSFPLLCYILRFLNISCPDASICSSENERHTICRIIFSKLSSTTAGCRHRQRNGHLQPKAGSAFFSFGAAHPHPPNNRR